MLRPVSSLKFALSILCCSLLVGSLQTAHAQGGGVDTLGTGGKHTISGRIYFPSGVRADMRLKVRLESTRYQELSVLADSNGSFGFKSLLPGSYTVVVEGGDEYETVRETIYIDGEVSRPRSGIALPSAPRSFAVQIHLQPKRLVQASAKPGVLNAVLARVPDAARKAYEKSFDFSGKGDSKKAIEQLRLAISLHPSFPIALNELGVQYLKAGEPESAVQVLQTAVKLDPEAFTPRLNYGIALLQRKRFGDAKTQIEEALQRNPNSASAHLYMGIAMIHEKRYTDAERSFVESLRIGRQTVSLAHYYLGGLYWQRGDHKLAAEELEKYVQASPKAPDAERIKQTIKELRSKL